MASNFMMRLNCSKLTKLEELINCICGLKYNVKGLAKIELTKNGMKISFKHQDSGVLAVIVVKSSSIADFYCNTDIEAVIHVREMATILYSATLNDYGAIISNEIGSNLLRFNYGDHGGDHANMTLMQTPLDVSSPQIEVISFASLPSNILKTMIAKIQYGEIQYVSFDMTTQVMTEFFLGQEESFKGEVYQYNKVWFHLPHLEVMRRAAELNRNVTIKLLKEPVHHIILQFEHEDLGYLEFLIQSNVQSARVFR